MAKSGALGRAVLVLTTDGTELEKGLDSVSKQATDKFKRLGSDIERSFSAVKFDPMIAGMNAAGKAASASGKLIAGMGQAGREAADKAKALAEALDKTDKSSSALMGSIGKLAAAFSISGLIDKAVGSIVSWGKEAIASAGALSDMSAKTGLSVESLQRFEFAGKQAGVSVEDFTDAAFKLGVKLSTGSSSTRAAVEHLGLSFQQLKTLSPDEQFDKIVAALERMEDPQERNRLGIELFGKSFATIAPAVAAGYSEMARSAEVSSKEQIKAIDDASDALDRFIARQKTRFTSALGSAILLHDAVAKLPEGYAKFLLDTDKSIKTIEDLNAAMIRAAGGVDVKLASDKKLIASGNAFSIELAKDQEALKGLTKETLANIQAGDKLGHSIDEIVNDTGLAEGVIKLAIAQFQKQATAQNQAAEAAKQYAKQYAESVQNIDDLLQGQGLQWDWTAEQALKYGASVADVARVLGQSVGAVKALSDAQKSAKLWDDELARQHLVQIDLVAGREKVAHDARMRALTESNQHTAESIAQTGALWEEYYALQERESGVATDAQIADIRRWFNDRVAKMKADDVNSRAYYDALVALANEKMRAVQRANDPLFQAWRDLNRDMRMEWSGTWESALDGTRSFGAAFVETLQQAIVSPFKRMIAALLAEWEDQLLSPLLAMFRKYTGSLFNQTSGGGNYASLLGAFARGGGGGGVRIPGGEFDPSMVYGQGTSAAGGGAAGAMGTTAGYAGIGLGSWMLGNYLGGKFENKYAGAAIGAGAGAATGAAIGSVVPGIGTGIGAGVGAIAGAIAGWRAAGKMYEEVKKQQAALIEQFGGMEGEIEAVGQAYAHMGKTGAEAEAALHKMWDARTPEAFAAAVKPVAEALDKFQRDTIDIKNGVDAVLVAGQGYSHTLPNHIKASIAALMQMKGVTDEQRKSLQAMLDNAKPNYEALTQKAAGFGITLDGLGPKFQQVSIEARSKDLADFLIDATAAGGDVGGMLEGLQDEISALVNDSLKFGSAIPDNMKPYIEELARAGKLTDENGNKIEDLTNLKFEKTPLDEGLDKLTKSIDHLSDVLDGVPSKIDKIGDSADSIPDNPYKNWQRPDDDWSAPIPIPMAAGGMGRVTRPTLFMAGEAGPEEYAFSGGGKSFGTNGLARTLMNGEVSKEQPDLVVVRVERDDPEAIWAALPDKIKHNYRGIRTQIVQAVS